MNVKELILQKFHDGSFALLTDTAIAKRLRLNKQAAYGLRDILHSLVKRGELLMDSSYRFGTAEQFHAIRGTISGNERGFAFFMPDDRSGDLFIPAHALNGALHGDTVLAIPVRGRSDDEGEILAVLDRGYKTVIGTFRRNQSGGYLIPDERKLRLSVDVPKGMSKNAREGDKVTVKILSYDKKSARGEVIEVLGKSGDFFTEEEAIILSHNLRTAFPNEVLKEAETKAEAAQMPLNGRLDLRDKLIITVDGEDTRDIDDAISVEKQGDKFLLGVHIADVSHYVTRGSALDNEAFTRGTSVYFPDRVLPMLPPALSNGICSLNEGEDRLTLSCLMTVDQKGNVLNKKVVPSVIRSVHRMTYTDVTSIYNKDKQTRSRYPDLIEFIDRAIELTRILQQKRKARGSVALEIKETKILYENGVISIPESDHSISHEMIEQFMVLANESVAEIMTERGLPFIYRIHESPSEDKINDFLCFLSDAGIRAKFDPANVKPGDFGELLKSLQDSPLFNVVNRVMLRSMMKARYDPENIGHFGLASDCYCHFTSPIRRYPDLCIHRIIKDSLVDENAARTRYESFVKDASVRSSVCEKNATDAERDVDALYIVAYMQNKIGEEFEGCISGVNSYGVFCELDNSIEGLIPIETLPDDSYEYIEKRFLLRGTRQSYGLGERVRVRVIGVDWGQRRVQFELIKKL